MPNPAIKQVFFPKFYLVKGWAGALLKVQGKVETGKKTVNLAKSRPPTTPITTHHTPSVVRMKERVIRGGGGFGLRGLTPSTPFWLMIPTDSANNEEA
jgi:hypothetical protein